MPCNSDHLEPNTYEIESRKVAKHLIYLSDIFNTDIHAWVVNAAMHVYGDPTNVHKLTRMLCASLRELSEEGLAQAVYNGRDPDARALADWWDAHQQADKVREVKEQADIDKEKRRQEALAKLSKEDKEILGL